MHFSLNIAICGTRYLDIVRTLHPDKSRRSASATDRFHEVFIGTGWDGSPEFVKAKVDGSRRFFSDSCTTNFHVNGHLLESFDTSIEEHYCHNVPCPL